MNRYRKDPMSWYNYIFSFLSGMFLTMACLISFTALRRPLPDTASRRSSMSTPQGTAMLHLAGCASFLTKDDALTARHRRGEFMQAAFIVYRQRHEIKSGKFTPIKEVA
jgi:hypothetical protein